MTTTKRFIVEVSLDPEVAYPGDAAAADEIRSILTILEPGAVPWMYATDSVVPLDPPPLDPPLLRRMYADLAGVRRPDPRPKP